jgi:hypothetical protein
MPDLFWLLATLFCLSPFVSMAIVACVRSAQISRAEEERETEAAAPEEETVIWLRRRVEHDRVRRTSRLHQADGESNG